ncbi:rod-binding protein [Rugamonas sp.]|uniref:rod-binding protein n=1 Tax=Rugamonas sp. TaxID=1926287 RepID=UPI0025F717C6|nr:rod-binding protein [Rugamonas sp.]
MTTLNPNLNRYKVAGQIEAAPLPADNSSDPADPLYRARATEAALKFESYFIGDMLHKMRSATAALADASSPFKNPVNNDMLDLTDNLVADQMASHRSFGIADAILRQLLPPAAATAPATSATAPGAAHNPAPPLNKPT